MVLLALQTMKQLGVKSFSYIGNQIGDYYHRLHEILDLGSAEMTGELSPIDTAKFAAARRAADIVENGMQVGLGDWINSGLARSIALVRECVIQVNRSNVYQRLHALLLWLVRLGLTLSHLMKPNGLTLPLTVRTKIDGDGHLIKGGGGALLWEKIVATASDRMGSYCRQSQKS